jgi:membrane-associated protease RseP (regulator of RpoE activity)
VGQLVLLVVGMIASGAFVAARYAVAGEARTKQLTDGLFLPRPVWERASTRERILFLLVGPAAVYVVAAGCALAAFLAGGDQRTDTSGRVDVVQGMPAAAAGVRNGDKIVMLDGEAVSNFDALQAGVRASSRETVDLGVERDGQQLSFSVPKKDGRIGVRAQVIVTPPDIQDASARALVFPAQVVAALARSVRDALLGPSRPAELAGPARLVAEMRAAPQRGVADYFQAGAALASHLFLASLLLSALLLPWRSKKTGG